MRFRLTLAAALIGAAALSCPGLALAQKAAKPADPIVIMMQQERERHKAAMTDLRQRRDAIKGAARITRLEAELEAARAGKPAGRKGSAS